MKNPNSIQRDKHLQRLRQCPIPQEVLAGLLERVAVLADVELEELVKDLQKEPGAAGSVLENLPEREAFNPFVMQLPWSGLPGSARRPCVARLECLCEYVPFPNVSRRQGLWDVAVLGPRAYLAWPDLGLVVCDISTPSQPVTLGRFDEWGNGVVVSTYRKRTYAFLASLGTLAVLDVTDPARMEPVWGKSEDDGPWGVALMGSCALMAAGETGLVVFDVTNPRTPSKIAELEIGGHAWGVATQGNYAYVANNEHLVVVDMSNPRAPRVVGHGETTGAAMHVWLAKNYAHVSCGGRALDVLDISTPAQPILLGPCDRLGFCSGAAFAGDRVFLADTISGLSICNLKVTSASWEWADSGLSSSSNYPKPDAAPIKQLAAPPPKPKAPAPGNHESSPEAQPVACRIEFHGEKALLSLDSSRSRAAEQTFEILVAAQKFEIRYELPRGRAKALRTLRRGTFNSHVMTCDSITDLPTTAGISSYAHDWVHGRPRSRNTWRPLATISARDEAKKRTPNYEYSALSKPGFWAVTLEMADGSEVSARSSGHPYTPQEFAARPGKRLLALLGAVRRRKGK
jgi:hypothetical protein